MMESTEDQPDRGGSDQKKNLVRAHIRLSGRVQGVAFRYYAINMAHQLGVKGWIRNLYNGDVEAVIEGNQSAVQQMIDWCRKGPSMAVVEKTKVDWQPHTGEYHQFSIRS